MAGRCGMTVVETHTEAMDWVFNVDNVLFQGRTPFQEVHVVEIPRFGKTIFLDYKIQSSLLDECIFHESMVHPAMITHPNPKNVFVAGGGEGATLRDALRHQSVQSAVMVDIDEELINIAKEHLPEWHQGSFDDPRTTLIHADARKVLAETKTKYDVILSDLTDPLEGGPAVYLFTKEFFQICYDAMPEDGVFALQAGTANINYPFLFVDVIKTLQDVFPVVRPYWSFVTTFLLPWGWVLASKKHDPLELDINEIAKRLTDRQVGKTRYYSKKMHHAMFALPPYIDEVMAERGRTLTDAEPFIWIA